MHRYLAYLRVVFSLRNAMRLLFAIVLVALLWSAFCVEERWRGRRLWEEYRRDAIARGVPMTMQEFARPEIPDAENYAAIPLIEALFTAQEARQTRPEWFAALKLDSGDSRRPAFPGVGPAPSLEAWRDYFVAEGVLSAASPDPVADVLTAVEKVA